MPHQRISSGKSLESVIGYSRAVRAGSHVYVAGTTGVLPEDHPDAPGDAYAQASTRSRSLKRPWSRRGPWLVMLFGRVYS